MKASENQIEKVLIENKRNTSDNTTKQRTKEIQKNLELGQLTKKINQLERTITLQKNNRY